mmetsp:Transcript_18107/g.41236  ORF Transcript_18107/g.41236 Transcript_18107/m.41236 type:complete len:82 (-) Transcript_18107:35-280(-)
MIKLGSPASVDGQTLVGIDSEREVSILQEVSERGLWIKASGPNAAALPIRKAAKAQKNVMLQEQLYRVELNSLKHRLITYR